MEQQFWMVFWGVIASILLAGVSYLFNMIRKWLAGKVKNQKFLNFLTGFTFVLEASVNSITQTTVDTLKKKNNFDKDTAQEVKDQCVDLIINQLAPNSVKYIQDNYGDIRDFVSNQIESYLHKEKNKDKEKNKEA